MSNIYFMCENCGIETNGITFVNGMKFCAKCYHQIFGKDNQQNEIQLLKQQLKDKDFIIKNLNHSLSVAPNANAGQRARIDELTKIVKEKDKEINSLIADYEKRISQEQESMSNMEHRLVEKQNKIDEISKEFVQVVHAIYDWRVLCAEKDKEIESLKQEIDEWVGYKFVKLQYQKAIQQLEKVKELLLDEYKNIR